METHHNHHISERFTGTRNARSAKKRAVKNGWACEIIQNANGHYGMYSRTDAIVSRPMTAEEAAEALARIRRDRMARTLVRESKNAITEKEINRLLSIAERAKLKGVRDALRRRKLGITSLDSEMARLCVFHRLYNSGLSSLARRQIDAAVKHGVATFAELREWLQVHASDLTCRGDACRELLARI